MLLVTLQETGDPASDVLYESNYLLLNLQEAFAVTGEQDYAQHAEQLAGYLARIQASSSHYPQYEGTWFRGFDYSRWEVFGSNADWGWPAFGIVSSNAFASLMRSYVSPVQAHSTWKHDVKTLRAHRE